MAVCDIATQDCAWSYRRLTL